MKDDEVAPLRSAPQVQDGETKAAKHTDGPYHWYAEDFSMVILCGETNGQPDPCEKHVMTLILCRSCHDRAKAEKREHWLWGDCHTPTLANATFLRRSLNEAHAAVAGAEQVRSPPSGEPPLHHGYIGDTTPEGHKR